MSNIDFPSRIAILCTAQMPVMIEARLNLAAPCADLTTFQTCAMHPSG